MNLIQALTSKLQTYRWLIVGFWALALMISLLDGALGFVSMASNAMDPIPGTASARAQDLFVERYGNVSGQQLWTVIAQCNDCQWIKNQTYPELLFTGLTEYIVPWAEHNHLSGIVASTQHYWSKDLPVFLDGIRDNFISADNRTAVYVLTVAGGKHFSDKAVADLFHAVSNYLAQNPNEAYFTGVSGQDPIALEGAASVALSMEISDAFCIPVSLAVLGFMVKSWRLLLITAVNLGTVIIVSFWIMKVISAATIPPMGVTAQFMEVMALAMSIDYSLFLFSRFKTEVLTRKQPLFQAVENMLAQSGKVVLISGLTLVVSFCGFFVFNCASLSQTGVANAITIALCVLVNLTLTPALLFAFPDFFTVFITSTRRRRSSSEHLPLLAADASVHSYTDLDNPPLAKKSFWFRSARRIVKWPGNLICIVVLYAAAIPLALKAGSMETRDDVMQGVDPSLPTVQTMFKLMAAFEGQYNQPIGVLVTARAHSDSILDSRVFDLVSSISSALPGQVDAIASIRSITAYGNVESPDLARALLAQNASSAPGAEYTYLWQSLVDENNSATLLMLDLAINPNAGDMKQFFHDTRQALAQYTLEGVDLNLWGSKVFEVDTATYVGDRFPLMIGVTCASIMVLMTVMFWSVFVPFRLLLTLAVPLAAVYGLAVLVYQDGLLNWTGVRTLQGQGYLYWNLPVITFSVCVGLAMDYDVFLISSVQEHRLKGHSHVASIILAVDETGSLITAAGVIMTVAFLSLLFQPGVAVVITGWIMVTSVIIDTFLVRMVLVPAVMSIASGAMSWWPLKVPVDNLLDEYGRRIPSKIESSL